MSSGSEKPRTGASRRAAHRHIQVVLPRRALHHDGRGHAGPVEHRRPVQNSQDAEGRRDQEEPCRVPQAVVQQPGAWAGTPEGGLASLVLVPQSLVEDSALVA